MHSKGWCQDGIASYWEKSVQIMINFRFLKLVGGLASAKDFYNRNFHRRKWKLVLDDNGCSSFKRKKFTCSKCNKEICNLNWHLEVCHGANSYRVTYSHIIKQRKRKSKVNLTWSTLINCNWTKVFTSNDHFCKIYSHIFA